MNRGLFGSWANHKNFLLSPKHDPGLMAGLGRTLAVDFLEAGWSGSRKRETGKGQDRTHQEPGIEQAQGHRCLGQSSSVV